MTIGARARVDDIVTLQAAAVATGNGTVLSVLGAAAAVVYVSIETTATVTFEVAFPDVPVAGDWIAVEATNLANGTKSSTATATGNYVVPTTGVHHVRARISAWTAGAVTATARGVTTDVLGALFADMSATVASLTPGTGATDLGKAEDAVHASGDVGVMSLAVRKDTAAATAADGDYHPLEVDATGRLHVNSELPDPVVLGDNAANPTTPILGAAMMVHRAANNNWYRVIGAEAMVDATTGIGIPSAALAAWNGVTFDRKRNNVDATVLASAARTAATNSADITNYNGRGLKLVIDITAVAGAPSLTFTIKGKDAVSGKYYTILASAALVGTGTTVLTVFPGAKDTNNETLPSVLPRVWRVEVAVGTADSVTYSVGASTVV